MVHGLNCESLTPTHGSDGIVTCLAIHSPISNVVCFSISNLFCLQFKLNVCQHHVCHRIVPRSTRYNGQTVTEAWKQYVIVGPIHLVSGKPMPLFSLLQIIHITKQFSRQWLAFRTLLIIPLNQNKSNNPVWTTDETRPGEKDIQFS